MKHTSILLILIALLIGMGCRKDTLINEVQVIKPAVKVTVRSDIKGIIRDENGAPIPKALVSIEKNAVLTNNDGTFHFKNITVPEDRCLVKAEKKGYFKNSFLFASDPGGINLAIITLKLKDNPQYINASLGGKVIYPDGSAIEIPANAILNSNGTPYTGTAELHAQWLDPTAPDLVDRMPGALQATNESGKEGVLQTYGMMSFELSSSLGEPLNLAKGKPATLTLPIPSSLQSNTPGTISNWYLDPSTGVWAPKGNSTSSNRNFFNINADSTGAWNLDAFGDAIWLNGTFLNNLDSLVAQWQKIVIKDASGRFVLRHFTSQAGTFRMKVLKNSPMTLQLFDQCNELVYEKEIGPFDDDHDLGKVYTDKPLSDYNMAMDLSANECSASPILKGLCLIEFGQNIAPFFYAPDGTLDEKYKMICNVIPEIKVTNYDLINKKSSTSIQHLANQPLTLTDIPICEPLQDSLSFVLNGNRQTFLGCRYRIYQQVAQNYLEIQAFNDQGKFNVKVAPYKGPGVYSLGIEAILSPWPTSSYPLLKDTDKELTLRIESENNEQIKGYLEGFLYPRNGPAVAVNIPFLALKSF